jgi:hypothetical protein
MAPEASWVRMSSRRPENRRSPFDCWTAIGVSAPTNVRAWTDKMASSAAVAFIQALSIVSQVING